MAKKKRTSRPHGHYCKICGEYKANEKFSGKGHAAHICKACSRLPPAEQAKAMTINRLMDFPMGRLSAGEKSWLENRLHDPRPEVAELAREVYKIHFPYAERNARKKQLIINRPSFEIHTEVFDEYGDELPVNRRFTANRINRVLTMADFDTGGETQALTLDGKKMSTLLRWAVHSLEIFMWPEGYNLGPAKINADPYLDLLPEYRPDGAWEDELPEPEGEVCWRVEIEYADHTAQEIVSCLAFLPERPEELYLALLAYFEPETGDLDGGNTAETRRWRERTHGGRRDGDKTRQAMHLWPQMRKTRNFRLCGNPRFACWWLPPPSPLNSIFNAGYAPFRRFFTSRSRARSLGFSFSPVPPVQGCTEH